MAGAKKGGRQGQPSGRRKTHGVKRSDTHGAKTIEALSHISQKKQDEEVRRSLKLGLEAADSVIDRTISLFSRGHQPSFAGINTFMKAPYCEDIRKIGGYEAAFVGAPFESLGHFHELIVIARGNISPAFHQCPKASHLGIFFGDGKFFDPPASEFAFR